MKCQLKKKHTVLAVTLSTDQLCNAYTVHFLTQVTVSSISY